MSQMIVSIGISKGLHGQIELCKRNVQLHVRHTPGKRLLPEYIPLRDTA